MLKAGLFIAFCGFALLLFTGNLLPDSSSVQEYAKKLAKPHSDQLSAKERGDRTYFAANTCIRYLGWGVILLGLLLAIFSTLL